MVRLLIFALLFIMSAAFAKAQNVQAFMNFNTFYSPKDGPYIETYISIDGRSVNWKEESGKYSANVEATIIFMKDTNIVNFSKVVISSGLVSDSLGMKKQFMNIQRFTLPNGNYKVRIKLDDLNDTLAALFSEGKINIHIPEDSISISSIEAVEEIRKSDDANAFNHSGYNLIPNIYNFIPSSDSVFTFYAEIYNIDKSLTAGETYLLTYYIKNFDSKEVLQNYRAVERRKAKNVDVLLGQFNISQLPSGNYLFKVEVINKENKVIADRDYFFQRENLNIKMNFEDVKNVQIINTFAELITGKDTLIDVIRAMRPISSALETEFEEELIKKGDIKLMQQFIYNFWQQRNPNEPSKPFIAYMKQVMKVNNEYGTSIKKGYETDRGYVYLKYGAPNHITKQYNEPATYPYEIWQYYQTRGQRNVKFVFYEPDLVTNDFALIHSNAVGEISNYQWRLNLRKRDQGWRSIDQTGESSDEWGTHYNEYYNEPR